jgi:PilZ domain
VPGMTAPLRTTACDLSVGGCYVEAMFSLEIGAKLQMKRWLGSAVLEVAGIVATCYPQVGNGIQFSRITDEVVWKLGHFVAGHAPADADDS